MRYIGQLVLRLVLGSYLAVHGAQKLFGSFGGHGLEGTGKYYESLGLKPGRQMAALAGAAELGGGILTATGIAHPLGPVAITGAMATASTTHIPKGALNSERGFELPLTNLAAAVALAAAPAGPLRLGPRLSKRLTSVVVLTTAGLSAYSINLILKHQRDQAALPPAGGTDDTTTVTPVANDAVPSPS